MEEEENVPEVVVTGHRSYFVDNQLWWWDWGNGGSIFGDRWNYSDAGGGGGGGGGEDRPPPDSAQIEVKINFTRALTAEEQRAVDAFKAQIAKQTATINALADDAKIKLKNGDVVTGRELKEIWSKTDFVINEAGTSTYQNGSGRGEANYNHGDPLISLNIDVVKGYNDSPGGIAYLVAHELAHMTDAGRDANREYSRGHITYEANEQVANDIARAIVNAGNDTVLMGEGITYSDDSEQYFTRSGSSDGGETGASDWTQYQGYQPGFDYASQYYDHNSGYYYHDNGNPNGHHYDNHYQMV